MIAAILVSPVGISAAQADAPVAPEELKAAFLFNFAKFTEWPESTHPNPDEPLVIGIAEEPDLAETLERAVAGRRFLGHAIEVRQIGAKDDPGKVHLLYLGASEAGDRRRILDRLRGVAVLTVGESNAFLEDGGIIRLHAEGGRLRFAVNMVNAERVGLRISSRLLALATEVERNASGGEGR
jgi:hypothetical protein